MGEDGERDLRTIQGANVHVVERGRLPCQAGLGLQHHAILVELRVHRRHLALAKGIVESRVHRLQRHAQAGRDVAVYLQIELQGIGLLIAGHVTQFGQRLERIEHARRPLVQLDQVRVLQGVLVLGARAPSAHAHILYRLQEQHDARDRRQLGAQLGDDLVRGLAALPDWFELDENIPRVARRAAAADEGDHRLHRRMGQHDLVDCLSALAHGRERHVLRRLGHASELPGVLLGKQSLGHRPVEKHAKRRGADCDEEHQVVVAEHPSERPPVAAQHAIEESLGHPKGEATRLPGVQAQQARGHHRRQGE